MHFKNPTGNKIPVKYSLKLFLFRTGIFVFFILLLLSVFAPWISNYYYDWLTGRGGMIHNLPPDRNHIFGTTKWNWDVFGRILYGIRYSVTHGWILVCISMFFAIVLLSLWRIVELKSPHFHDFSLKIRQKLPRLNAFAAIMILGGLTFMIIFWLKPLALNNYSKLYEQAFYPFFAIIGTILFILSYANDKSLNLSFQASYLKSKDLKLHSLIILIPFAWKSLFDDIGKNKKHVLSHMIVYFLFCVLIVDFSGFFFLLPGSIASLGYTIRVGIERNLDYPWTVFYPIFFFFLLLSSLFFIQLGLRSPSLQKKKGSK